jgi:hypothetical protein
MRKQRPMNAAWMGLLAVAGVLGVTLLAAAEPPKDKENLVVHEWGTFLTVQGSDGVTLGGMVDSEEALPPFVRERDLGGLSRAKMFTKMETPVTYFYTDRPRRVQVQVAMPQGLLTHWFPVVHQFGPPKGEKTVSNSGSFLDWGDFEIIPDTRPATPVDAVLTPGLRVPQLYSVAADNTWRFARETDSALVKFNSGGRERFEKFLFYRGLGMFDLPLEVRTTGAGDAVRLALHNRGEQGLRGLFAVWVDHGLIRHAALADLAGGATSEIDAAAAFTAKAPLADGVPAVKAAVADALVKEGLYAKEAQAMVNTWEKSYFRTEGLRILSVLPRTAVDVAIPIRIAPAPAELVRVMVGRVEVLTPDMEEHIAKQVAALDVKDEKAREAATAELDRLGRLKEPVLRRILTTTKSAEVRVRVEKLIAKAPETK